MSKGDRIGVVVDGIEGILTTEARQAGRTVEYDFVKESLVNWLVVKELTRGGTVVQESRYPAEHVRVMTRTAKEVVSG